MGYQGHMYHVTQRCFGDNQRFAELCCQPFHGLAHTPRQDWVAGSVRALTVTPIYSVRFR